MADEEFYDCVEAPIVVDGEGNILSGEKKKETKTVEHVFTNVEENLEKTDEQTLQSIVDNSAKTPLNEEKIYVGDEEKWGDEDDPFKIEKDIIKALEEKEEGNKFFRAKDYDASIQHYSNAIAFCPETPEHAEQLATFYGNRSAAYFAEEEHELVIEDCTDALKLKGDYVKVIARRMQSYDKLEKYEEALADAKRVKELDPSYPKIDSIISRLQRLYDEKMAKMKDEALGKLKDLGNTILGNFGLSLDNFKMVQDPNTGSWSVSMNSNN